MENKKQLVIIPPMSQPMQKLHEVLNGIVEDENIEISLIENSKEFGQFVGSSGQSLVVFSNPKLCVTFLQENRSVISKTHSKVILLTPKEIPAKTLVKFVKLGLTESILDGSPPKTLLYKVKLLLRSIKSTSTPQEDKSRVVKSSQEAAQAPTDQDDLPALKNENESEELNPATEEKSRKFKNDEENVIDYGGRLKGKNKYQEESIDTNWKSKRNNDSLDLSGEESSNQKVKEEESDDIDMYYRGKKKNNISIALEEAYSNEKKSSTQVEESVADYDLKKRSELDLELGAGAIPEKKKAYQEEESDPLSFKKNNETIILLEEDEKPREKILTQEEKEEARKKELLELDALFEAARKKQAQEVEDLGGHYKGKIDNTNLNLEVDDGNDEDKPKKEYDNSELFEDEKKIDLVLVPATEDNRRSTQQEEEDDDQKPSHEGEVDNINEDMTGEGGASDRINTLMITKTDKESSKKLVNEEELDLGLNKHHDSEEESDSLEIDKKKTTLELLEGDSNNSHKKDMSEAEFELDPYKRQELEVEASAEEFSRKSLESEDQGDQDGQNQKTSSLNLQLADGDDDRAKSTSQNEESDIEFKKLKNSELDLAGADKKERSAGKVDEIDKYYRSGEAKKVEHSWDNLTSRTNSLDLNLEKATRGENEEGSIVARKDLGEITIDYRKLKEEFDYIAKNGAPGEEGSINERSARSINDSDDEGTFKVIELNARGFEFGIDMVNLIYQKDSKAPDFYKKVSEELISQYKGYPIFYTYKSSDKKHTEVFDSIIHFGDSFVSSELKEWWINTKTQKDVFDHYFEKTMATWLCRDIQDKSGNGSFWEDVELPSWAANELTDKKVEMIFPYFDGVDRMGVAVLIFPTGVNPVKEKSIMVTLEMVRTILLESIQRKLSVVDDKSQNNEEPVAEKKNIMSMFSGLFNRNKAG